LFYIPGSGKKIINSTKITGNRRKMMKEKDYTITIDVHVSKESGPNSKRRYALKMYGHPITESNDPITFEVSNMRDEMTLRVGKSLLNTIWDLVEGMDKKFWED
jgi:hypothetical protein